MAWGMACARRRKRRSSASAASLTSGRSPRPASPESLTLPRGGGHARLSPPKHQNVEGSEENKDWEKSCGPKRKVVTKILGVGTPWHLGVTVGMWTVGKLTGAGDPTIGSPAGTSSVPGPTEDTVCATVSLRSQTQSRSPKYVPVDKLTDTDSHSRRSIRMLAPSRRRRNQHLAPSPPATRHPPESSPSHDALSMLMTSLPPAWCE